MAKFKSDKNFTCDRCFKNVPAYYTLSVLTKGLWVQCPTCGTHPRKYVPNLFLPYRPSKHYLRNHNIKSDGLSSSADQAESDQQLQVFKEQ